MTNNWLVQIEFFMALLSEASKSSVSWTGSSVVDVEESCKLCYLYVEGRIGRITRFAFLLQSIKDGKYRSADKIGCGLPLQRRL